MQSSEKIDLQLSRYASGLKRRWLPALSIFAVTVTLSGLSTTWLKPSYQAEGKLLFKHAPFQVLGTNVLPTSENEGDLKPLVASQNPISTQIEVLSSPTLLEKVIKELKLTNKQGELLKPQQLKNSLSVKIIGGTDVLNIAYTSQNPKEAAAVVNKLMRLYIDNDISVSRLEAEGTRNFIAQQLPQNEATVRASELSLRRFKEKNQIVNLIEEAKAKVGLISNLDNQIANVSSDLEQAKAQSDALRNKIALSEQQAIAVSSLSQSPAVQGILKDLQDIERQLATERGRFQDDNPTIVYLQQKKANLESLLQKQTQQTIGSQTTVPQGLMQIGDLRQNLIKDFLLAEVQRSSLATKLSSLYNSRSAYESRMKTLPQLEQKQHQLEQIVEIAQSTYQNLLKKVQELQLAANKNTANARIIATAMVPDQPVSGTKMLVLVLGVLFGAFFSITTVLLLEMRDRSIKTLQEVREVFGYTLLGIIPLSNKKGHARHRDGEARSHEIAVRDMPNSLTSEIYRMIQANLKFLSSDKVLKTIVVSSALPKEGKSTVSANLATAIAQLGRQVLLIDADMRLPSQHHLWDLTNAAGLSEVLVGKAEFSTAACKVMDNLDVLTTGVRPPNPLALLDSKRMASLIQYFSNKYDFVIIDAPPLLLAADALTLSQMTDGMLLVARPGVLDYTSAAVTKEILESSAYNVLGLVVNGMIDGNENSSYFYHAKEYFTAEEERKQVKVKK